MRLPTVSLGSDLLTDVSGNEIGITPLGVSFYEEGTYPRLLGGRTFVANVSTPFFGDFTVEFRGIPQGGAGSGCLVTTTTYRVGVLNQIAVYVQAAGIYLYQSASEEIVPLSTYSIPTNKRGKVIDVTVVRSDDTFMVYLDGDKVIEHIFPTTLSGDGYALLGETGSNGLLPTRGFVGVIHHVRLHHGIALPPEMFELNLRTEGRSASLSKLTAYVSDPRDLGMKLVSRVAITSKALIIQFSTGELFAALRESFGPPGTLVSNVNVRGANADQVWVTLTSGQEIQAGVQQFFEAEDLPEFPSGTGYLIEDAGVQKFVPLNVYGDGKQISRPGELILSTLAQSPLSYDENTAIILEERYAGGQNVQHTGSAGAWVTKPYFIKAGPDAVFEVSAAGNVILPVGVYRVIGTHTGQQNRSLARLYNVTSAAGLVTSNPAMAVNNLPCKFFDVGLTIVSPTEISIQSLSEVSPTAAAQFAKLLNAATVFATIKIYRVE